MLCTNYLRKHAKFDANVRTHEYVGCVESATCRDRIASQIIMTRVAVPGTNANAAGSENAHAAAVYSSLSSSIRIRVPKHQLFDCLIKNSFN